MSRGKEAKEEFKKPIAKPGADGDAGADDSDRDDHGGEGDDDDDDDESGNKDKSPPPAQRDKRPHFRYQGAIQDLRRVFAKHIETIESPDTVYELMDNIISSVEHGLKQQRAMSSKFTRIYWAAKLFTEEIEAHVVKSLGQKWTTEIVRAVGDSATVDLILPCDPFRLRVSFTYQGDERTSDVKIQIKSSPSKVHKELLPQPSETITAFVERAAKEAGELFKTRFEEDRLSRYADASILSSDLVKRALTESRIIDEETDFCAMAFHHGEAAQGAAPAAASAFHAPVVPAAPAPATTAAGAGSIPAPVSLAQHQPSASPELEFVPPPRPAGPLAVQAVASVSSPRTPSRKRRGSNSESPASKRPRLALITTPAMGGAGGAAGAGAGAGAGSGAGVGAGVSRVLETPPRRKG